MQGIGMRGEVDETRMKCHGRGQGLKGLQGKKQVGETLCSPPRVCHPWPLPCVSIPDRGSKRRGVCLTCCARLGRTPAAWTWDGRAFSSSHTQKSQRSQRFSLPAPLPPRRPVSKSAQTLVFPTPSFETSPNAAAEVPQGELETWLHPQPQAAEMPLVSPHDPKRDSPLHKSSSKAPPRSEKTPQKTYITLQLIFTNLR